MRLQIWVWLVCVISPHSNGAVQIRVGLELAELLRNAEQERAERRREQETHFTTGPIGTCSWTSAFSFRILLACPDTHETPIFKAFYEPLKEHRSVYLDQFSMLMRGPHV